MCVLLSFRVTHRRGQTSNGKRWEVTCHLMDAVFSKHSRYTDRCWMRSLISFHQRSKREEASYESGYKSSPGAAGTRAASHCCSAARVCPPRYRGALSTGPVLQPTGGGTHRHPLERPASRGTRGGKTHYAH